MSCAVVPNVEWTAIVNSHSTLRFRMSKDAYAPKTLIREAVPGPAAVDPQQSFRLFRRCSTSGSWPRDAAYPRRDTALWPTVKRRGFSKPADFGLNRLWTF